MSLGSRTVERGRRAIFRAASTKKIPSSSEPGADSAPVNTKLSDPNPLKHVKPGEGRSSWTRRMRPALQDRSGTRRLRRSTQSPTLQDRAETLWLRRSMQSPTLQDRIETLRLGRRTQSPAIDNKPENAANDTSVRVQRVLQKLSAKAAKQNAKKEHEATTRRLYAAKRKMERGSEQDEVDWREILSKLVKHTPKGFERREIGTRVVVPRTAIGSLLYHPEDNIWKIRKRTYTEIDVLPREEGAGGTCTLLVSGILVSQAVKEIHGVVSGNTKNTSTATKDAEPLKPCIVEPLNDQIGPTVACHSLAPKPTEVVEHSTWTKESFEYHVLRLTRSGTKTPRRNPRLSTMTSETHDNYVRNHLRILFEDPRLRDAISVGAFNTAMVYFIKTGQIKDARRLFVSMEMSGLEMNTETFNVMLRGAAKVRDLHNFAFLLGMMLKREILPNHETWLAFLGTLTDFYVQLHVIAAMRKKGLLSWTAPIKALSAQVSFLETEWSILKGHDLIEFVMHMDKRYGPHWLTTASANRVFHQLALHGLISRCCTFAEFMRTRLVQPDTISLHTVISHCNVLGNFEGAIHALRAFQLLGVEPDDLTYHQLFSIAMEQRLYSSARVVWRYACLNNATTYHMRNTVARTSRLWISSVDWDTPIPKGKHPHRKFWLQTVGKVILGNATALSQHPALHDRPILNKRMIYNPLWRLSDYSKAPYFIKAKGVKEFKKAKGIDKNITLDLLMHEQWYPARNLSDVLGAAFQQDAWWNKKQVWREKNLLWMFMNAVGVKVFRRAEKRIDSNEPMMWVWK